MLYSITADQVLRSYMPVLDDPSWFQLLSAIDSRSFANSGPASKAEKGKSVRLRQKTEGAILPIDRRVLKQVVEFELEEIKAGRGHIYERVTKVLHSIVADESDIVMWLGKDGTVALRSILVSRIDVLGGTPAEGKNIDRKPPTLIKSLPLARMSLNLDAIDSTRWSSRPTTIFDPSSSSLLAVLPPTASSPAVAAVRFTFKDLLLSLPSSVKSTEVVRSREETIDVQLEHKIEHFVRTPNGRGLLALTESGEVGVWYKERLGKLPKSQSHLRSIVGKGQWNESIGPKASAIFSKGRAIVFYTDQQPGGRVTLQHLDHDSTSPSPPVVLPDFELDMGDEIAFLMGVSDIDDGFSGRGRRTQRAVIVAASKQGHAWIWKVESRLVSGPSADTTVDDVPKIRLLSHHVLPVEGGEPHLILPVDPMGWHTSVIDWENNAPLQDMILTVSKDGVLEFWSPELEHHYKGERPHKERVHIPHKGYGHNKLHPLGSEEPWKRSSVVRTGRSDVKMARCSSRKKTVLSELPHRALSSRADRSMCNIRRSE